jgi:hypothetical protein
VARKKRRKPKKQPSRFEVTVPSHLSVGSRVRVKSGVCDPDFNDIPLGGWTGTIEEIEYSKPLLFVVRWEEETLRQMHPVYQVRCDREGLDHETIRLGEDDLEPAAADDPVQIEQPTTLIARPLDLDEEEDRVRQLFGLTSDDPLPPLTMASLRRYHALLSERISFPVAALVETGRHFFDSRPVPVLVRRLLPVEEADLDDGLFVEVVHGEEEGVMPLACIDLAEEDPNYSLLADYCYWLEMAESDEDEEEEEDEDSFAPSILPFPGAGSQVQTGPTAVLWGVARLAVYLAGAGAVVGAVMQGVDHGQIAVMVGAGILGIIGLVLGSSYGRMVGAMNRLRGMSILGGILGGLGGAALGSVAGALIMAFVGSLLGCIAGSLLGVMLAKMGWQPLSNVLWALLGALIGALVLALIQKQEEALPAALWGAVLAGVGGGVVFLGLIVALTLLTEVRE